MGTTISSDPNRSQALKTFVELRLGSQVAKWTVIEKELEEGKRLPEERMTVREAFVGAEEAAINEIWTRYDTRRAGNLDRKAIRQLLADYLHEVNRAIPQLVGNAFRKRERGASGSRLLGLTAALKAAGALERQKTEEIRAQQAKVVEMIGNIDGVTDAFMRKIDRDKNGRVDRVEFIQAFRKLLYTTADKVDLSPVAESKIDKEDEEFFFDDPVDTIDDSAPKRDFKRAISILGAIRRAASADLRAKLDACLALLQGVRRFIVVNEEDVLIRPDRMLQGQSGGEADAQSLEFLTYYLPLLDKGRRRHYANVIRGFSGEAHCGRDGGRQDGPAAVDGSRRRTSMLRHTGGRAHSYSMPALPTSIPQTSTRSRRGGGGDSGTSDQKGTSVPRDSSFKTATPSILSASSPTLLKPSSFVNHVTLRATTRARRAETASPVAHVALASAPAVSACLSRAMDWKSFDIFELDALTKGNALVTLTLHAVESSRLASDCRVRREDLAQYLSLVQARYRGDNPYHNAIHAADVVHAISFFLRSAAGARVPRFLALAALVAGAVHDVNHPGTNNNFQINTGSRYAYLYNDQSVLENMHLSEAFLLLKGTGFRILQGLGFDQRALFRKAVIEMVLATDMSKHGSHTHALASYISKTRRPGYRWLDPETSDDYETEVKLFLNTLIHAADLANAARPLALCTRWVRQLYAEFYAQGDRERALGLKVSPLCDRSHPPGAGAQVFFIGKIVAPLYASFYSIVPELKVCMQCMRRNKRHWEREAGRGGSVVTKDTETVEVKSSGDGTVTGTDVDKVGAGDDNKVE